MKSLLDKLSSGWDWFMVGVLYVVLKLRWFYFHVSPSYYKIWITEEETHFIHKTKGTLHSHVHIHLTNGKVLK